ncbi:MAG: B12-binding domain-containing protein, partial [Anaerolineales bacterium]|nr:B12-binding domain-containing protein [Anaerolineales bacterium]
MSIEALYQAVLTGNAPEATNQVTAELEAGTPAGEILNNGCIAAMSEVGRLFEEGELYVPEMLIAA